MGTDIDSLAIVRALRVASGYLGFMDSGQAFADRISEDPAALTAVAEEIRYQAWTAPIKSAVPDNSQFGEFKIILNALVSDAASPGIVVDVGACARSGSNSYDLITNFGWRGILIEAFPKRASKLRDEFGDGDYRVVECAVGLTPGPQPLWLGAGAMINSLDQSVAEMFKGRGESIEVEVRRLVDILDEHDVPHEFDLIDIDIEGPDVDVFNDLIENSPYRPKYVIIECPTMTPLNEVGFAPMVMDTYRQMGSTIANRIFKRV